VEVEAVGGGKLSRRSRPGFDEKIEKKRRRRSQYESWKMR